MDPLVRMVQCGAMISMINEICVRNGKYVACGSTLGSFGGEKKTPACKRPVLVWAVEDSNL
jgi:hypothetical protein